MEIIVKSDEIRNLGNQMLDYCNEFDAAINRIKDVADKLSNVWQGEDATRYINVLQETFAKELFDLKEVLNNYGQYLSGVSNPYEILDSVYANKHIEV